ncbi:hypothetical protein T03_14625 [Trichinella britovi]|uniref:Uncharacterized protein n=1 Tax=Trichinella britovi TaxID=45882 RepID=A0A0V1C8N6_TRIBR|nr:hypothetical protein T03_14625 [Trichinella britovi]
MTPASEKKIDFVFTFGIPGGTLLYAKNFTLMWFLTTSFNAAANECPASAVTAAAPFTQLAGASEARNLPMSCEGPLYNIALYTVGLGNFKESLEVFISGKPFLIGLMQFYFIVSLDNVIFIGILRVIFILLLSAYLFQKCKDKSGLLMERNDNADRNLLVSEI